MINVSAPADAAVSLLIDTDPPLRQGDKSSVPDINLYKTVGQQLLTLRICSEKSRAEQSCTLNLSVGGSWT